MREICIEQEALPNAPTITLSLLPGQWAEPNHGELSAHINLIIAVKQVVFGKFSFQPTGLKI